ncbi:hypothetical protein VXI92_002813 [Enterobacter hormaechei]|jgi:hypothetical protein|uniref:Uncharacterized protein n=1 Tax=Enterobacter hormaechei TaxID=158836 RepID=A0ABD7KT87_9ENTR|nr:MULTISPECIES: hypothetical protein [Enterobacter]HAS1960151.1 hypothetical protein [Enterobacter cloacae]HCM9173231.1 hypothetical protein [Enterobacter hormaechei subsp. steigerwaltii]HDT2505150.1 hypothetical protein [Enterobacter hormaechei subsp. oharae]EKS6546408.1 hypothetical protein [Enterobacter hormaechei]EKS6555912.1 hypothetical protein [Enterobacter hormaechei]
MNFSKQKQANLTRKVTVRAFKVNSNNNNNLYKQIAASKSLAAGTIIQYSATKHIKCKELKTINNTHFIHFTSYNPNEQVSVSPINPKDKDLFPVKNHDNLHAFYMIKGNKIASLMLISTNWPEVKTSKLFGHFKIDIIPTCILRQDTVAKLQSDGLKAVHVNLEVMSSDFNKQPGFLKSLIQNEPAVKQTGISGHLTIDHKGNPQLAKSIENNPTPWISDLDSDFYFETKKSEKITSDSLRLTQVYYTIPYGAKSILSKYAEEILSDFVKNEF